MPTNDQELRQKGFGLYAPGTPVPPGHMILDRSDGTSWVGPESAFQEPPLASQSQTTGSWLVNTGLPAAGGLLKRAALPTIGQIGGTALGGAVPGAGAVLAPIGGAAGAAAGLYGNQLLGIEQPTKLDYALTAGLSAVPGLMRGAAKLAPGSEAAQMELGQRAATKLAGRVLPETPSSTLYATLPKQAAIALPHTATATGELATEMANLAPSLRTGAMKKIVDAASQLSQQAGGVSPEQFQANVTQFGRIVRQAQQTGAIHERSAARVFGALMDDLDAVGASNSPYAAAFREASGAYKRELASQRLEDILSEGAKGVTRSRGGIPNTNWDAAINKLNADKELARWLPKDELNGIRDELRNLARTVPQIQNASGPGIGGQTFAQRALLGGTLGAAAGHMFGQPWLGGAVGSAVSVGATEGIARMLTSAPGRALLRGMLARGVPFDQIGQLARQLELAGARSVLNQ